MFSRPSLRNQAIFCRFSHQHEYGWTKHLSIILTLVLYGSRRVPAFPLIRRGLLMGVSRPAETAGLHPRKHHLRNNQTSRREQDQKANGVGDEPGRNH